MGTPSYLACLPSQVLKPQADTRRKKKTPKSILELNIWINKLTADFLSLWIIWSFVCLRREEALRVCRHPPPTRFPPLILDWMNGAFLTRLLGRCKCNVRFALFASPHPEAQRTPFVYSAWWFIVLPSREETDTPSFLVSSDMHSLLCVLTWKYEDRSFSLSFAFEMEWRLKACGGVRGFTKPAALFTNHDMEPEINTFYTEIYVRPSSFVSHPDWRVTVFFFCAALLLLGYWWGWWLDHGSKLSVFVLAKSSWGMIHLLSLVYESETWVKVVMIVQGCRT